jgi:hypothetical protein
MGGRVRVRDRASTVSPPVGNCVGGVSMRSPPTWNGGGNGSGRGCGQAARSTANGPARSTANDGWMIDRRGAR